ncbi:MAG TPA: hypothetical protein VNF47_01990 [Streptosporangiaceae bacterium]|nr:hypothetical protein [Streptosporangiaceae bacterium]
MRADPLAIVALATCGVACLLTAAFLSLYLLGRLPRGRKSNARAYRLQQTAGLVMMTMILLAQVAALAHWARPVRLTVDVLAMLSGAATLAVLSKAAAWSWRMSSSSVLRVRRARRIGVMAACGPAAAAGRASAGVPGSVDRDHPGPDALGRRLAGVGRWVLGGHSYASRAAPADAVADRVANDQARRPPVI